jgi:hypothetical protein
VREEEERNHRPTTTENTQQTSLRFCSKFTCIDFFARARFSLSRAALSRRRRGGKEEEAQRGTEDDTETTVV